MTYDELMQLIVKARSLSPGSVEAIEPCLVAVQLATALESELANKARFHLVLRGQEKVLRGQIAAEIQAEADAWRDDGEHELSAGLDQAVQIARGGSGGH